MRLNAHLQLIIPPIIPPKHRFTSTPLPPTCSSSSSHHLTSYLLTVCFDITPTMLLPTWPVFPVTVKSCYLMLEGIQSMLSRRLRVERHAARQKYKATSLKCQGRPFTAIHTLESLSRLVKLFFQAPLSLFYAGAFEETWIRKNQDLSHLASPTGIRFVTIKTTASRLSSSRVFQLLLHAFTLPLSLTHTISKKRKPNKCFV
ncbi:hypothetical protein TSMEX_002178 [Taenia solium]|eukprot:TsM_000123800 transcript=TsM_000123800 gene=TsM_000123800